MFDSICTYPLSSDLFSQSIHPSVPLLALGLASGHVQIHRLPPSDPASTSQSGHGTIETAWRTRRHKGSCRSVAFSYDGENLFSAGTDGLLKAAATETGQVVGKICVPLYNSKPDLPSLLHPLTPTTLLLGTDASSLHLYDLRTDSTFPSQKPQQTYQPHDDYITSLTPLPPSESSASGLSKQWLSTGGSTVAITDLRRGVLVKSEDQGEELLSSTICGGRVVVGGEKGVLRSWEVGVWDDNEEVLGTTGGEASVDVIAEVLGREDEVVLGGDDGVIRFVRLRGKGRGIVEECRHDEIEGVGILGFEVGGRMVSGGGSVVKIWEQRMEQEEEEEEEEEDDEVDVRNGKKTDGFGSDSNSEDGGDYSSDEEEKPRKKRKKKKRNKGIAKGGQHHVMGFRGMD